MQSLNRRYISQVDEIRAFAALLVLFFHCLIIGYWTSGHQSWINARSPIDALLFEGHTGVTLFMVLSGYILSKGTFGKRLIYADFLTNRIIRIFPLMTVVVIAAISAKRDMSFGEIAAPFLLMQNVSSVAMTETSGIIGTVWTISVEFQFYLIAPFLFAFISRYGFVNYVLPLVLFFLSLRTFMQFAHRDDGMMLWQYPYYTIVGRMNQFVIGICLAWKWDALEAELRRYGKAASAGLVLIGLGGMMLLSYAENRGGGQYAWHWWRIPQQEVEAALWGSFIAGYIVLDPLAIMPRLKAVVQYIGVISFSIYILHWSVMTGIFSAFPLFGLQVPEKHSAVLAISICIILPVLIAVSSLSYACIERPFLQIRKRYVGVGAPLSATKSLPALAE